MSNDNVRSGRAQLSDRSSEMLADILSPEAADFVRKKISDNDLDSNLVRLSCEQTFAGTWDREGLTRKERSLVTLGILIALRATGEMKLHFRIGINNGFTPEQLQEVIIHAMNYAGVAAANHANEAAMKTFEDMGLLDRKGSAEA